MDAKALHVPVMCIEQTKSTFGIAGSCNQVSSVGRPGNPARRARTTVAIGRPESAPMVYERPIARRLHAPRGSSQWRLVDRQRLNASPIMASTVADCTLGG